MFLDVLSLGWNKGFDLLVEAYFKEFTAQDDVTLVLKVLSSGQRRERPTAKDIILGAVRGRVDLEWKDLPHLVVLDETLSRERMLDLYAACDLYISLSRANGWGMAFAEAMAMGKPASGIDWSGNTEFMNRTNSLMIETTGRLVPVDPRFVAQAPNFAGHRWADVEVQEVQRVMRYAYEHSTELKQIAERGMKDIREHYSLVAVARRVVAALSDMPVSATRHRGRPRVRFKNALGLKFRARLLYHRWRYRLFALLRRPPA